MPRRAGRGPTLSMGYARIRNMKSAALESAGPNYVYGGTCSGALPETVRPLSACRYRYSARPHIRQSALRAHTRHAAERASCLSQQLQASLPSTVRVQSQRQGQAQPRPASVLGVPCQIRRHPAVVPRPNRKQGRRALAADLSTSPQSLATSLADPHALCPACMRNTQPARVYTRSPTRRRLSP